MEHPHKESSAEEELQTWFGKKFFKNPQIREENLVDGYILEKFYTGQPYLMKDIRYCINTRILETFTNIKELKLFMQGSFDKDMLRIIFEAKAAHWVLIYIKKVGEGYQVFYKDPEGKSIPQDLKKAIQSVLAPNSTLITYHQHTVNDLAGNEEKGKNISDYTGAITIRNVEKMDVSSAEGFKKIKFTTVEDLVVEKLQQVAFLAHELIKEDASFLTELKKIKTNLPTKLVEDEQKFRELVKPNVKNRKTCMSPLAYQVKRDEYLNKDKIDEVKKKYEDKSDDAKDDKKGNTDDEKKDKEGDEKKGILNGVNKFKAALAHFKKLMYLMSLCAKQTELDKKKKKYFDTVKKLIKDLFDMNYDELASALDTVDQNQADDNDEVYSLPQTANPTGDKKCKSLEEFIGELKNANANKKESPDIEKIRQLYASVMQEYETKINQFTTTQQIQDWAKDRRKQEILLNESNLVETMAMLVTGLKLVKGYGIRIPHLFTLLYAVTDVEHGKIFQVQTGEGKTNIVALLAILKVLQGKKVDVITSNIILAKDGVQDTKDLFSTFCISVDHNDPNDVAGKIRNCYTKDVVYGSITTFQFDYLRDRAEGFQYRDDRPFHELILDEVDNMLIDNGGYIAKLAEPFPGMESLRYMYIHIWIALSKVEKEYGDKITEETNKNFGHIDKNEVMDKEQAEKLQADYEKFLTALSSQQGEVLKDLIKKAIPRDVVNKMIPSWVQGYVDDNLDKWIENAIYAKYECQEDVHYTIDRVQLQGEPKDHEHSDDEDTKVDKIDLVLSGNRVKKTSKRGKKWKVVPLDYENTGIAMTNTIWSDGLHQFVQLKHNLHLTFENLTSSYISNIGYIKLFKKPTGNITGLTGTVGSTAEQKLLDQIYKVDFVEIPTFRTKNMTIVEGMIEEDRFWCQTILQQTVKELLIKRAVLIICETVQDAKSLEEYFYRLLAFGFNFTLKKYYNEDHAKQKTADKNYRATSGSVILATNLAGRGTDFKTTEDVEKSGGLHVIVGFLPCNERVQKQAFGRTSRTGNNGSVTIVMRESQAKALHPDDFKDFNKVSQARDRAEKDRLDNIRQTTLVEIEFKDELFQNYANYHLDMKKKQFGRGQKGYFLMKDFKEQWACWLKKEDLSCEKIKGKQPAQVFNSFTEKYDEHVIKNPYYEIVLADEYINSNRLSEAKETLENILEGHQKDKHLLAAAHFKLFDVAVQNGKTLEDAAGNALKKIFAVLPDADKPYKSESKGHLVKAMELIKVEIEFLGDQFLGKQGALDGKPVAEVEEKLPKDMESHVQAATKTKVNPFLKHLHARRNYLTNLYLASQALLGDIDKLYLDKSKDFFTENRGGCETFVEDAKYGIYFEELAEFATVGLNSLYTINEVVQLSDTKTTAIQVMLGCGVALIPVAVFFPVIIPLVVTLISEAICDLIFAIIEGPVPQEDSEKKPKRDMSEGPYIRDKLITIGLSLFLIIGSASSVVASAVQKAINACKAIEKFLEKIPVLKKVIQRLIDLVKKVRGFLQKALDKMLTVGPKLTAVQTLKAITTGVGKNVFKNVSGLIIGKIAEAVNKTLKSIIEKSFSDMLEKNHDFVHKLNRTTTSKEDLEKLIKDFGKTKDTALSKAVKGLSAVSAQCGGNAVISLGITAVQTFQGAAEVTTIIDQIKDYLDKHIEQNRDRDHEQGIELLKKCIVNEGTERIMEMLNAIGKNWQRFEKKIKSLPSTVKGIKFDVTKEKITQEIKDNAPNLLDDVASGMVNNMWDSYLESNENLKSFVLHFDKTLDKLPPTSSKMRQITENANDEG